MTGEAMERLLGVSYEAGHEVGKRDAIGHAHWVTPHWKNSASCANCSHCKSEAIHNEYRGVQEQYRFCPFCGYRMDEEE